LQTPTGRDANLVLNMQLHYELKAQRWIIVLNMFEQTSN